MGTTRREEFISELVHYCEQLSFHRVSKTNLEYWRSLPDDILLNVWHEWSRLYNTGIFLRPDFDVRNEPK